MGAEHNGAFKSPAWTVKVFLRVHEGCQDCLVKGVKVVNNPRPLLSFSSETSLFFFFFFQYFLILSIPMLLCAVKIKVTFDNLTAALLLGQPCRVRAIW